MRQLSNYPKHFSPQCLQLSNRVLWQKGGNKAACALKHDADVS